MREIKFRIWDNARKTMYSFDLLALFNEGVEVGFNVKDNDPKHVGVYTQSPYESMPLMQFTGLKDKNGKEIYEGDIVKDSAGRNWFIKWGQSIARFVFELIEEKKPFNGRIGNPTRTTLQAYLTAMDEIIGNIYQNPELLKATT